MQKRISNSTLKVDRIDNTTDEDVTFYRCYDLQGNFIPIGIVDSDIKYVIREKD